jgi:hypothetical protein
VTTELLSCFQLLPPTDEGVPEEFSSSGSFQGVLLEAVGKEVADLDGALLHLEFLSNDSCQLVLVLYVEGVHPRK